MKRHPDTIEACKAEIDALRDENERLRRQISEGDRDNAVDQAARRKAEAELHASQHLLQALVDHTPSLIFAKDTQGRCILTNRPLDAFFGVARGALLGTKDEDVLPAEVARAQKMLEALLAGVASHQATIAIVDITGVKHIDDTVARMLVQAAQAAGLLGARVVLTGIAPGVARSLVGLGVDLSRIVTRGTLQSGIAYALKKSHARANAGATFAPRAIPACSSGLRQSFAGLPIPDLPGMPFASLPHQEYRHDIRADDRARPGARGL